MRNDFIPELSLTLEEPVASAQLIVNLRAEADPETLRDAVRETANGFSGEIEGLNARLEHLEYFRPGKPEPTHRDLATGEK